MKLRTIFVFSHDSIGLGEDGPTHQPIEHLTMLRATPNLTNWRPCDATETVVAWQAAIERKDGPTTLLLTRQAVPAQPRTNEMLENISRGGYILLASPTPLQLILIATGSEVDLCLQAAKAAHAKGIGVQVVSMPCTEVFDEQDKAYQNAVLPEQVTARIAVEAGATLCWHKYVGTKGRIIGIDRFGESAPIEAVYEALGVTVSHIEETIQQLIKTN